jgi:transposase
VTVKRFNGPAERPVFVAIDIAKARHHVLIEFADGKRTALSIANTLADFNKLASQLKAASTRCEVALEPTGDYHRPIANFLLRRGHNVQFVSSIATHRTRETLFNSWDKNDPKDAQVILHLLKGGVTQRYADPLQAGYQDLQELLGTYSQVVGRKTRVYHSLMTHYLPLYFPEAEPFLGSSRSEWFLDVFLFAPCPAEILKHRKETYLRKTVKGDEGHPTVRRRLVAEFYETAKESVGIPIAAGSVSMQMFKTILAEYIALAKLRRKLEKQIHDHLDSNVDYQNLRTIPGIGPIVALTILSEAGDLRRFSHYRKFLKYCGFDLSTSQSGTQKGTPQLSKRGNARLRCAFWMAARAAVAMRRNGFRKKFDDYTKRDPLSADLRRKAYSAVAAKMARVSYGLIKSGGEYRHLTA